MVLRYVPAPVTTPATAELPAVTNHAPVSASTTYTIVTRAPRVFPSVVYDPKDVAVGDQYGGFKTVKAWYEPATASYPDAMYSIDFVGTTTIRGVLGETSSGMGCFTPLEDIPAASAQQLPRSIVNPQLPTRLDLYLEDAPAADRPAAGDAVEVTIDRFVGSFVATTCGDDHGHVISIKKI